MGLGFRLPGKVVFWGHLHVDWGCESFCLICFLLLGLLLLQGSRLGGEEFIFGFRVVGGLGLGDSGL